MNYRAATLSTLCFVLSTIAGFAQTTIIEGYVKAEDGTLLEHATIQIERTDAGGRYKVTTDRNGHYFYAGLPVGVYRVSILVGGTERDSVDNVQTDPSSAKELSFDLGGAAEKPPSASVSRPEAQPGHPSSVVGLYMQRQNRDAQLRLDPDGSFSARYPSGLVGSGSFSVSGDELTTRMLLPERAVYTYSIHDDKLYQGADLVWIRQMDEPAFKFPCNYVNAQTRIDMLRLNADNSFSLKEADQPYHGTFVIRDSTIELSIVETNTKTTLTRKDSSLIDSSGQTWLLQEQSAHPEPARGVLKNQDVIALAKAGLDDAIILAKITSSSCQFNTSPEALIKLKQSGVSTAVLKAMLAAEK